MVTKQALYPYGQAHTYQIVAHLHIDTMQLRCLFAWFIRKYTLFENQGLGKGKRILSKPSQHGKGQCKSNDD